jgi:hypothetical protein
VELAITPSPGLKDKISFYRFTYEIRAPDRSKNSKYGVAGDPDWDSFYLQTFSAKTNFA